MSSRSGQSLGVRLLAVFVGCTLTSCSFLAPNRAVALSTSPPGATVIVDGQNIGFVTPCMLQFDVDEDVRIDMEVAGFRRETRFLTPHDEVYSILWTEMYVGPQTWHFPLFLSFRDFLVPVKWTEGHAPGRIHIDLDRLSDDVEAERAGSAKSRSNAASTSAEGASRSARTANPGPEAASPR